MRSNRSIRRSSCTRRRGGYTLIEVLITFTIFSFVSACASLALATLWRAQGKSQEDFAYRTTSSQLARQFRADAHLAVSAQLASSDGRSFGVTFIQDDSRTEYTSVNDGITRVVKAGDNVVHREVFKLPAMTSVEWTLSNAATSMVEVSFRELDPMSGEARASRIGKIDAAVGVIAKGSR